MDLPPVEDRLTFEVIGEPRPQGSKKAFVVKGTNRAVITDDNPAALKMWRTTVREAATDAMAGQPLPYFSGDVAVRMTFTIARPKSVTRKYPGVKPDIDKLVRAVYDAFTDAKVWEDDARVIVSNSTKVYGVRAGLAVDIRAVL